MPSRPSRRAKLLKLRSEKLPKAAAPLPMRVEWPDGRVEWVYSIEGLTAN